MIICAQTDLRQVFISLKIIKDFVHDGHSRMYVTVPELASSEKINFIYAVKAKPYNDLQVRPKLNLVNLNLQRWKLLATWFIVRWNDQT